MPQSEPQSMPQPQPLPLPQSQLQSQPLPRHTVNLCLCCVPSTSQAKEESTIGKEQPALSSARAALFGLALLSGVHVRLVFVPQHKLG